MAADSKEGIEDYVNVIIFGSIYGIMMILIIGHVLMRWQTRRKSLTKWKARTLGGSWFRNKHVRQQISEDFATIRDLTSDPRLIDDSLPPNMFGGPIDSTDHPAGHWFRMKAFDSAADFVSSNMNLLTGRPPFNKTLPQFLNFLLQRNILPEGARDIVATAIEAYKNARYNIGEFNMNDLTKFNDILAQLKHIISSGTLSGQPSVRHHSTTEPINRITSVSRHDKARYSQEPLLELTDDDKKVSLEESTDILRSLSHSARPKKPSVLLKSITDNRPMSLEIPLIDSQTSTPLGSSTSSPFFSHSSVQ